MIDWNKLTRAQRLRILMATTLPTALASALWSQLTQGERDAIHQIDWSRAIR